MQTKEAAQNSLYIIVFSQATGLLQTLCSGNIPNAPVLVLTGMILCGIMGSEAGRRLNRRLLDRDVTRLLEIILLLIILISCYNFVRLAGIVG